MTAQPGRLQRGKLKPIVDLSVTNRAAFEEWLHRHGMKPEDLHRVERLVVRPDLDHVIAVFPWSQEEGQLYIRLRLAPEEIVRIDRDAPHKVGPTGNLYPATDTLWRDALTVKCPTCRARPGDWCATRGGPPVARGNYPHGRRLSVFRHGA